MDPRIVSTQLHPALPSQKKIVRQTIQTNFHDLLTKQIQNPEKIKLSKHAEKRLVERGIEIDNEKWSIIQTKVSEAKRKGVNDSLVILNNAALVINAKSNTVITALDRNEAATQIFTNINGTILID
jgi:flagellar operon protein